MVVNIIQKYPKTSLVTACIPLAHSFLKYRAKWGLEHPMYAQIVKGTKPDPIAYNFPVIHRPKLEIELAKLIGARTDKEAEINMDQVNKSDKEVKEINTGQVDKSDEKMEESMSEVNRLFGVVIGPSGTGKTLLTRQVCRDNPNGILYVEVFDPLSLTEQLAETAGMSVSPKNLFDLVLSHISETYCQHHFLPRDSVKGVSYVLNNLAKQGKKYREESGRPPCLVIDGVDLVAKSCPQMFVHLVDRAKYMANAGLLRIIFVSSEGSVMPLIGCTSSRSRAAPVIEVADLPEKRAKEFLRTKMPLDLTDKVISLAGGRLSHLITALYVYENATDKSDVFNTIKDELRIQLVGKSVQEIYSHKNSELAVSIINLVALRGSVHQEELSLIYQKKGYKDGEVPAAIDLLISKNFLRYQRNFMLTCHSKFIESYVRENLLK